MKTFVLFLAVAVGLSSGGDIFGSEGEFGRKICLSHEVESQFCIGSAQMEEDILDAARQCKDLGGSLCGGESAAPKKLKEIKAKSLIKLALKTKGISQDDLLKKLRENDDEIDRMLMAQSVSSGGASSLGSVSGRKDSSSKADSGSKEGSKGSSSQEDEVKEEEPQAALALAKEALVWAIKTKVQELFAKRVCFTTALGWSNCAGDADLETITNALAATNLGQNGALNAEEVVGQCMNKEDNLDSIKIWELVNGRTWCEETDSPVGEGEDFLGGDDGEEEEDMPTNRQEEPTSKGASKESSKGASKETSAGASKEASAGASKEASSSKEGSAGASGSKEGSVEGEGEGEGEGDDGEDDLGKDPNGNAVAKSVNSLSIGDLRPEDFDDEDLKRMVRSMFFFGCVDRQFRTVCQEQITDTILGSLGNLMPPTEGDNQGAKDDPNNMEDMEEIALGRRLLGFN